MGFPGTIGQAIVRARVTSTEAGVNDAETRKLTLR